jgi:predicted nucleic acid-binding protein
VTVVVDASFLVAALLDSGPNGRWAESVIERGSIVAPELVLVETANVLRRLERVKQISSLEATSAHRDALRLDLALFPYEPFAPRIWALRENLTSYDAWYVALAEALDCPLATLDARLARASGPTCEIITPPTAR